MLSLENRRFLVGILGGIIIGVAVGNLRPIQADDTKSMKALLEEVQALKKQGDEISKNMKTISDGVKSIDENTETLVKRSDFRPPGR